MTPDFWQDRRVLITGHTGFKGAWLAAWLDMLKARISGFALAPEGLPNLWSLLVLDDRIAQTIADINDRAALDAALARDRPEIVFHFAAQSLVRRSYHLPVETFAANVLGVVSLLQAVARAPSVRAVVIATSDKCYENLERAEPYTEADRFGGRDPYSASKGCAEIAAAAMRQSFFRPHAPEGHPARIATVRAGNVIGGGDWSEDRLVPDIIRGCLGPEQRAIIRAPRSIRPWQHVLEPLAGYMALAEKLHSGEEGFDSGWNFGPGAENERPVIALAQGLVETLGRGRLEVVENPNAPHEARILRLDASKAQRQLGWTPTLDFSQTLSMTADWYARWAAGAQAADVTRQQIQAFTQKGI
ncbi:MAG: CDP-glucose 4,6-dehydratase [Confluentimicrobium sp.]|uniref:CDP-glucose 4,6-dehydratase n=1 Tax=Actibacterium sp. TaxID=1872125 RepID=UPI000C39BFD8|nr:CDP-glucose 4,6-dehydratase [Actibacterium sp.]MBC58711.1 CDP-glucose 4,6-dehydratase [Actibacterium sp.]|tara:strand:+ start:2206 stop:3282 length:1077 start_codon:yes stop_codon:yes gene_type:complete